VENEEGETYSVGAVLSAPEVYHAVETGECCASTLVAVGVELLLR